jgi:hypothetical protein
MKSSPILIPREPIKVEDEHPPRKTKGTFITHTIEWTKQLIHYTGIVAAISAAASMIFLVQSEEPRAKKVGKYAGNCYLIAERILIVAVVALVALKIFTKWRC